MGKQLTHQLTHQLTLIWNPHSKNTFKAPQFWQKTPGRIASLIWSRTSVTFQPGLPRGSIQWYPKAYWKVFHFCWLHRLHVLYPFFYIRHCYFWCYKIQDPIATYQSRLELDFWWSFIAFELHFRPTGPCILSSKDGRSLCSFSSAKVPTFGRETWNIHDISSSAHPLSDSIKFQFSKSHQIMFDSSLYHRKFWSWPFFNAYLFAV